MQREFNNIEQASQRAWLQSPASALAAFPRRLCIRHMGLEWQQQKRPAEQAFG
jgi:hypothetical protein